MTTNKQQVAALAAVCFQKGIRQVVISPGSRSAPLVIAFQAYPDISKYVIADERVAGFFALGLAQQTRQTVALICTSGTAALNFAPAVCEAFYQQVPLLVLTADRPAHAIGVGENQAINQQQLYQNYCRHFFNLSETAHEAAQQTADAIHLSRQPFLQPVHINIPLAEPLYETTQATTPHFVLQELAIRSEQPVVLPMVGSVMVLCGLRHEDAAENALLEDLAKREDTVVVAEPVANVTGKRIIAHPDRLLSIALKNQSRLPTPDFLITVGKQVVSKRLRQWLKQHPVANHIHLSPDEGTWNGFGAKHYTHFFTRPAEGLQQLVKREESNAPFATHWHQANEMAHSHHQEFSEKVSYSDWQVFESLIKLLPENAIMQYGNSSPIRYACLFDHPATVRVFSNRGTSGIDGCLSTAVGAALAQPQQLVVAILGDISFLYDSNALWNPELPPNLKIVVINNGGGNIFGMIPGPDTVDGFESFFQTKHQLSARHLAAMYGISYQTIHHIEALRQVLPDFYTSRQTAIMEVFTDSKLNATIWKEYFSG